MKKQITFIEAAFDRIRNQSTSSYAKLITLVDARHEDHWANRIMGAWDTLRTQRNDFRVLDLEDGGNRVKSMPTKPEQFLSLCQNLMNQSCWAARQYVKACEQNAIDEAVRNSNGKDYSQDVAEEIHIEPMNFDEIEATLQDDLRIMQGIHSDLAVFMNYLPNIEDLRLYADREQEGEIWRIVAVADTYAEATDIMDEVGIRMREREDKTITETVLTRDYANEIDPIEELAKIERGATAAA